MDLARSPVRDLGAAPPFASTAEVDGRDLAVTVDGDVPGWLAGDLLRTAPAVFERDTAGGRFEAQHWFDGLGMLYRFRFDQGRVAYRQRLLATAAEQAARAGRVDQATWATPIQRGPLRRLLSPLPPLTDNTNVNVLRLGDDVVALTETTAQWVIDPETLAPIQRVTYRDDLGAMPMIAHAHFDFERDVVVNVGLQYGRRNAVVVYEHAPASRTRRVVGRIPCDRVPYVHGFGLTPRHAVVYGHPCDVNPMTMLWSNAGFVDHLRWDGSRPTRLHLVDRATGAVRTHLAPTGFMFHVVNAFEDGADTVLDAVVYPDASVHDGLRRGALLAHGLPHLTPRVVRYRMTPGRERATDEVIDADGFEFPIIRYRERNGRRHGVAWGARLTGGRDPRATLVRHGDDGARTLALDAGFGEPVFVARPGGEREDDGVLLTVGADPAGQRSRLLVVAADTLTVLATASVATPIPLGFHGSFLASAMTPAPTSAHLRDEAPADLGGIFALHAAAFPTDAEARLVDRLRAAGALTLSLVAELDGRVVGHVAFSPVTCTQPGRVVDGVGLGPVAVVPALQRHGLGGALVAAGLARLRATGASFCVVLGHATYYPRFGFERASRFGMRWEHPVPDEVFFALPLRPGGLDGVRGVVRYRPEFDALA